MVSSTLSNIIDTISTGVRVLPIDGLRIVHDAPPQDDRDTTVVASAEVFREQLSRLTVVLLKK